MEGVEPAVAESDVRPAFAQVFARMAPTEEAAAGAGSSGLQATRRSLRRHYRLQ